MDTAKAIDRFWLRLWWWVEGRAFKRLRDRWPTEYHDYRDQPPADFLTDAYKRLVERAG